MDIRKIGQKIAAGIRCAIAFICVVMILGAVGYILMGKDPWKERDSEQELERLKDNIRFPVPATSNGGPLT